MTPEIVAMLVSGGIEASKALLMLYFESQRVQGKNEAEIREYMKSVSDEYFSLPDPTVILDNLPKR